MGRVRIPHVENISGVNGYRYTTAAMSIILTPPGTRGRWGYREESLGKSSVRTKGTETKCGSRKPPPPLAPNSHIADL
jgi:hypothetical protein